MMSSSGAPELARPRPLFGVRESEGGVPREASEREVGIGGRRKFLLLLLASVVEAAEATLRAVRAAELAARLGCCWLCCVGDAEEPPPPKPKPPRDGGWAVRERGGEAEGSEWSDMLPKVPLRYDDGAPPLPGAKRWPWCRRALSERLFLPFVVAGLRSSEAFADGDSGTGSDLPAAGKPPLVPSGRRWPLPCWWCP